MRRRLRRLVRRAIAEDVALGILQHAGNGAAQFPEPRRDLLVHSVLVEHRGQKADGDDNESLILRRPQRHGEAVDVRAP